MDKITDHINEIKAKLPEIGDYIKEKLPEDVEGYLNQIKTADKEVIVDDFTNFRITPVTVSISLVGLTTVLIFGKLLSGSSSEVKSSNASNGVNDDKSKKKKKKVSKAQKTNKQIQDILDNFEEKWVPEIGDYLTNYKKLNRNDLQYRFKYFEELLLKELFKLDGIDVLGNEVIRENRKKVIQFIQEHQKRLDAFKKEVKL